MRIFVAGASGVIGAHLVPLLVDEGHSVAGMTRSESKAELVARRGAEPVVCDVFDAGAVRDAVVGFGPEAVIHELTALPDDPAEVAQSMKANNRIRREGTQNLLAAAAAAGVKRFLAQSVAFALEGDSGVAVAEHEEAVLAAGGVVLRYGSLYGPGTYAEDVRPPGPAVHVAEAARRTAEALNDPSGVITIVDPSPGAPGADPPPGA